MGGTGDHEKQPLRVEQTEENASPIHPPQKKRTIKEKLGIYNILVLVFGTAAIFLALAFLLFVWIQSDSARRHRPYTLIWFKVVSIGWTPKVVTLSTVLIRLATGAQLGVFAALVAALILERGGASTADLPQLSIIRCANTGPQSLFRHVIHSIPVISQLGYSIIIVITILNMAVMQLISTILLTDMEDAYILKKWDMDVYYGLDSRRDVKNTWAGIDYWTTSPASYPRFAEYTQKGSQGANYVDTGTTYRGFLPFGTASEREAIRDFNGPMTVVDARTVCVKPSFSGVTYSEDENDGDIVSTIAGTVRFKGIPDALLAEDNGLPFNCSVVATDLPDEWAISLCFIRANQTGGPHWSPIGRGVDLDRAHLWINMSYANVGSQESLLGTKTSLEQSETSDALWAKFGHDNIAFDTSLCFFNPTSEEFKTRAWTTDYQSTYSSQDLTLYWNSTDQKYNVENLVDTLGATKRERTPQQRGVFSLDGADIRDENVADRVWNVTTQRYLYGAVDGFASKPFSLNSTAVQLTRSGNVHRSHTVVVQNILKETRNPTLALQALFTIILQMAYYDFFTEFDLRTELEASFLESVTMPIQWTGFGVVLSLLALHFAILIGVLVLFLMRTEMSLLGNAWQAVSQVHSTDTADVVQKGAMATDEELYGKKSKHGSRVLIVKSTSSGRAEATYVHPRQRRAEDARSDEV